MCVLYPTLPLELLLTGLNKSSKGAIGAFARSFCPSLDELNRARYLTLATRMAYFEGETGNWLTSSQALGTSSFRAVAIWYVSRVAVSLLSIFVTCRNKESKHVFNM